MFSFAVCFKITANLFMCMTKSYLATQFWVYMSDKCQFYLFSKIIKKSIEILVKIKSYKQ